MPNSQKPLDRRSFCKLAAGSVVFAFSGRLISAEELPLRMLKPARQLVADLPVFDGVFLFDASTCRAMADDFGHYIHRMPWGVLFPRSARDVQEVVRYARAKSFKVAMRGHGCSAYGQSQVEGGIVINTADWNRISWAGNDQVDVSPGSTWHDVVEFTSPNQLTPPVLPDTLFLTVGGSLSVGGLGETSYRLGAAVDHVVEMDVVTGTGELVPCSKTRNANLYHAVLAGMGQSALIVRARLQLLPAPSHVAIREFSYNDHPALLQDLALVARLEPAGAVVGNVKKAGSSWALSMTATTWINSAREETPPPWLTQIAGRRTAAPKIVSYYEYVNRQTKSYLDAIANGSFFVPHPYMSFFLPESPALAMSEFLTQDADANLGATSMPIFPMINQNFHQPLQQMPGTDLSYHFRIYRKPQTEGSADHLKMLKINNEVFLPAILRDGGRFYLPHAPLLSTDQLREHFGKPGWELLTQSKKKYDPDQILNPGAGFIF